jgi:flagellin-specific chaperone FliS
MNLYRAYRQQESTGWARIDMLLALFDRGIEHLENGLEALRGQRLTAAQGHLGQARLVVAALASGVNPEAGEAGLRSLQLYEFVLFSLGTQSADSIEGSLRVLSTLRDGYRAVRAEAADLERRGVIPPLEATRMLQASA